MHFHNFGSANVVGIHSCTNLQKENIFYPIAGIIDIPNMQHTVLFNVGGVIVDCWSHQKKTIHTVVMIFQFMVVGIWVRPAVLI